LLKFLFFVNPSAATLGFIKTIIYKIINSQYMFSLKIKKLTAFTVFLIKKMNVNIKKQKKNTESRNRL